MADLKLCAICKKTHEILNVNGIPTMSCAEIPEGTGPFYIDSSLKIDASGIEPGKCYPIQIVEFKTSAELSGIALQIRDHILDYDITKAEAMIIACLIMNYMNDYFTRINVDKDLNVEHD